MFTFRVDPLSPVIKCTTMAHGIIVCHLQSSTKLVVWKDSLKHAMNLILCFHHSCQCTFLMVVRVATHFENSCCESLVHLDELSNLVQTDQIRFVQCTKTSWWNKISKTRQTWSGFVVFCPKAFPSHWALEATIDGIYSDSVENSNLANDNRKRRIANEFVSVGPKIIHDNLGNRTFMMFIVHWSFLA